MLYTILCKFTTKQILWWDRWYTYVVIAGVFVCAIIGAWTGAVAGRKGRSAGWWYVIGFFLPIIGLIIIYSLHAKGPEPAKKAKHKETPTERAVEKLPSEKISLHVGGSPEAFKEAADEFFLSSGWVAASRGEGKLTYEKKDKDLTELTSLSFDAAEDDRTKVTWSYVRGFITDDSLLSIRDFLKALKK